MGHTKELIIRVPENDIYPLFFMVSKDGKRTRLSIELAETLLKEAGLEPVYKPIPFPRGLKYLETGEIHLMLNLSIKKDRAKYTHFIGRQLDETVILVIAKNSRFNLKNLDDIKILKKPLE